MFTEVDCEGKVLRPCQLAAILLKVYGVRTGTKLLIEMKTGEGKTYVCGVAAAVVAKLFNKGPAVILTSSVDRAYADKKSTTLFIEKYLGYGPISVSELKPGLNKNGGQVAYGQVSDAQRIVVDMLTKHDTKGLYKFLKTASFFLDEADHVLIEQAESLLYIASPCPSYYSLHGVFFNIQYRIDYEGDFTLNKVKTRSSIQEKAKKLTNRILDDFSDYEHKAKSLPGGKLYPTVIDLDTFVASSTSGAMSARFKKKDKEYVIEVTTEDEHLGTISNVKKITIVDTSTGTESDGTRWTTEAPFCEAMEGLPIGGSDPLAFYSSSPYLFQKLRWFGGITGTVGAAHTLKYYGETYDMWCTFRIPRNKPTTIYRLPTKVAENEDEQVNIICTAVMDWIQEKKGLPTKGPVLIIAESIQKARKISKKLQERGHALMKLSKKVKKLNDVKTDKNKKICEEEEEEEENLWTIQESSDTSGYVCAHVFPYFSRTHLVMNKFPDCAVIVASNKGGRGLDLKLDHEHCPPHPDNIPCSLNHHKSTLVTEMGSILLVILTDVLSGRQDLQAVGRCGRCGKAGVVQYILAKKSEDSNPITDPESVYLERKNKKDTYEEDDFTSKCNRICQHRFDGFVLDTFCERLPTYVNEWMLKLFPKSKKREKEKKNKTSDSQNSEEEDNDENDIIGIKPVISKWFMDYCIQAWAYWRSYGGSKRQPGDFHKHFEIRMGLASPVDLPDSDSSNPLQQLARRFWRFACVLRLSGEALYTFAKALLAADNNFQVIDWCIDILKMASSPNFEVGGKSLKLPPANNKWQPEFSGNAALLLARLYKEPEKKVESIKRAIEAINSCIARYNNYNDMIKKTKPEKLESPNRKGIAYYHVQREEIVRQLKSRKQTLERIISINQINENEFNSKLKHISKILKDPQVAHTAYCLCYGLCEVIFEWYIDEPFVELREETKKWMNRLKTEAVKLGADQWSTSSNSDRSSGGGSTEVKSEEQLNKVEKEGKAIMSRLNSETDKQIETNSKDDASTPIEYNWEPTAPTKDDIKSSKKTIWQAIVGWLSFVWAWLVMMITSPVRKYKSWNNESVEEQKYSRKEHKIWDYISKQFEEKSKQQGVINGDLISNYIGENTKDIINIVEELGPLLKQTDLLQEDVEIRTDGKPTEKTSRKDAKKQAKEEADDQIYLRKFSKEDTYLIGKVLEALKKMASEQKLEGFDDRLLRLLSMISQYNELAMEGKIDIDTAKKMNEGMEVLWENILRFAIDHGSKIEELRKPLENYNICKNQSKFTEVVKKVKTHVTEKVKTVVKVVEKVVKWVWRWLSWLWKKVKKVVNVVKKFVKEIPVVREVVEFVTEKVVNPVYKKASDFFNSAKETLSKVVSRISKSVSSTFNAVSEAVSKAVTKLGNLAPKAWNWVKKLTRSVKEAWLWKIISEKLVTGFKWIASKVIWVFVNVLKKIITWCLIKLRIVWSYVLLPILEFLFPNILISVKEFYGFILRYFRYWWQGAGDIMQDFIWGTEFDIIDVEQNRVTRFRMRLRAALKRVWASSWLQWILDKTIRLGLDIDHREHVQEQQSRAHNDYHRRKRAKQQKNSLGFSVICVVFSLIFFIAALFSGGALIPVGIALVSATISALLQYASMELERDMSIDEESKREIQNLISIVQSLLIVATLFIGFKKAVVITATVYYVKQIFTWLQKIVEFLRVEQKLKSTLQQIDRILRMFGIGGAAVVLMGIKTMSDIFKSILEKAGDFFKVSKWLGAFNHEKKDTTEQERDQDQQEELEREEEENEEDDSSKKEPLTNLIERLLKRTITRADGWILKKFISFIGASTKGSADESQNMFQHGSVTTYSLTPPNGGESISIKIETNQETGQKEAKFSRELSEEEKALFGFGDNAPSVDEIEKLFNYEEGEVNILSDKLIESKSISYINEKGQIKKREQYIIKEEEEYKLTSRNGKLVELTVQPTENGELISDPMHIDLRNGHEMSERIRGKVTEKHLKMLENILGSDNTTTKLEQLIENDLQKLNDLAKENKNKVPIQERPDSMEENNNSKLEDSAREAAGGTWKWAQQKIQSFLSSLWSGIVKSCWSWQLLIDNVAFRSMRYIWIHWISKTQFGKKITLFVKKFSNNITAVVRNVKNKIKTFMQLAWAYVKKRVTRIAVSIGLIKENEKTASAEEAGETPTAEDKNLKNELVKRLFEALLPKQTEKEKEKETLETKLSNCINEAFKRQSEFKDDDLLRAAEVLMGRFSGNKDDMLSNEQKVKLKEDIKRSGTAKVLFNWLYNIAKEKIYGDNELDKSRGDVVHEQMVRSGAGYSRQNMKFLKEFNNDMNEGVSEVVIKLCERLGVTPNEGIQQNASVEEIQAKLENFIREGDQQGLLDYVQKFLSAQMPEQFKDMKEKWKKTKDEEAQNIVNKLDSLVQYAWGQITDETVAKITHEIVEMMSKSVSNLWVKSKVELLVEEAIEKDVILEFLERESIYKTIEDNDGKIKLKLDKKKLSELHEEHVMKILQKAGYEVINSKLPSNNGIDVLAIKKNSDGDVVSILVVECKATTQKNVKSPKLTKTKTQGKQLSSTWIAEKMKGMYKQGGKLREAAIMMRNNLEKIKPIVSFQKDGINSWAHQGKVPKFDQKLMEELLKNEEWE